MDDTWPECILELLHARDPCKIGSRFVGCRKGSPSSEGKIKQRIRRNIIAKPLINGRNRSNILLWFYCHDETANPFIRSHCRGRLESTLFYLFIRTFELAWKRRAASNDRYFRGRRFKERIADPLHRAGCSIRLVSTIFLFFRPRN